MRAVARARKPGGGAAIPGVVVNKLAPTFLPRTLSGFRDGLVVVTGTAGKSTTTRILAALVAAHGKSVFTNPSTANIAQGLTSAVIAASTLTGKIDADIAILEMDEGHAAKLGQLAKPDYSVLLNVCVDQVDRFFDPAQVTSMLESVAKATTKSIIYNRDDASVVSAVTDSAAGLSSFGMGKKLFEREAENLSYVSTRTIESTYPDPDTCLESVDARTARIRFDGRSREVALPSVGVHYGVDVAAAIQAARVILGSDFDDERAVAVLASIDPVFGRGEVVNVRGHDVNFILVQNPPSLKLNIRTISPDTDHLMIAVGTDVRDYSYLWSTQLRGLPRVSIAAGLQARDVALHCLYNDVAVDRIETDLHRALDEFFALGEPRHGMKTVIFSADSMRRTRRYLGLPEQEVA